MAKRADRREKSLAPLIITSAQDPLSLEQKGRQRRYFISMMVRTGCFIASIFLPNPYRWVSMAGAVLLPYVAVVIANAGRETISGPNSLLRDQRRQIAGK
jgi:hypothetical protein